MQNAPTSRTLNHAPGSGVDTRLQGRWLLLARVIWVAIVMLALALFAASIPLSYVAVFPTLPHSYLGLSAAFVDLYQEVLTVAFACCFFAVAGVLFWRKSGDRIALFASFTLVTFVIAFSPTLGALPQDWQVPVHFVGFLGSACLGLLFYLFPTGQFVPRWTRWFSLVVIMYWAQGSLFPDSPLARISAFVILSFLGFIGSIVVAQVYRYRCVSSPLQRQQTKWVVFATSVALLGYIGVELLRLQLSEDPPELRTLEAVRERYLQMQADPFTRTWRIDIRGGKPIGQIELVNIHPLQGRVTCGPFVALRNVALCMKGCYASIGCATGNRSTW